MDKLFLSNLEQENLESVSKLLKECQQGFLTLFDSSPSCMSMTTVKDRSYIRINDKFLEKFGYSENEMIGRTSVEVGILDKEESNKVAAILKQKGRLQNNIVICKTKDGKSIHTISSIERIEIKGEYFMVSSFLDISKVIEQQNIIKQQNKEILESINYARIIQNSLFPSQKQIEEVLTDSFVLAKPKNIVSGDFHWIKKIGNKIFVSVCDCTGHGVPGALISIIGYKLLSKLIDEYQFSNPAEILNQLNREFALANKQVTDATYEIKDGMDISLCAIDLSTMTMEYAGAYNPIYLVRKGILAELTVDKIPIYLFTGGTEKKFNNYKLKIEKDDAFYLFSDGYADQFGGPFGKKFRYKKFQELILTIHQMPMFEQKWIFDKILEEWRMEAGEEQTDDILIVGFKV